MSAIVFSTAFLGHFEHKFILRCLSFQNLYIITTLFCGEIMKNEVNWQLTFIINLIMIINIIIKNINSQFKSNKLHKSKKTPFLSNKISEYFLFFHNLN